VTIPVKRRGMARIKYFHVSNAYAVSGNVVFFLTNWDIIIKDE
jgi:hypothetical protein